MSNATELLQALCGDSVGRAERPNGHDRVIRAVIWARVSTDMQEERGLSIPGQLREMRQFATARGIEVVEEFHEATSAFRKESKRVEFRRMLSYAKGQPTVSAILVHDMSRFSRDSVRAKSLVRELRDQGIKVISLNDPDVDPETVAGVYMEAITFAKNEAFSREIAMHTRKGCKANVQARDPDTGWCYVNGGQPLWGYRTRRIDVGIDKRGRPMTKSIWELDETAHNGRPVHEWIRHCLAALAAKGASLDDLRDFCNNNGIPGRRSKYWSTSTWHSLLQASSLLKFCGYGVWNVHAKGGRIRPQSEWIVVEDAHPPIITEDEAKAIAAARDNRRAYNRKFDQGGRRSQSSPYLLSGGLFKCSRCGSNMTGFKVASGRYYVCGSQPYRKGMGCGNGVYVPKELVEAQVTEGLTALLGACSDPNRFVRQVNKELEAMWRKSTGHDPDADRKLAAVGKKVANIYESIENGLCDTTWANGRLAELKAEKASLTQRSIRSDVRPRIDAKTAIEYRRSFQKLLAHGHPSEKKRLIRHCVEKIELAPELLEVEITYQVPEPVMKSMVAGAGYVTCRALFEAMRNAG